MVNKAVFLDRDGVLNELVPHDGKMTAPWSMNEFVFTKHALDGVTILKKLGYITLVVTNQPDVYDGKMDYSTLKKINTAVKNILDVDLIMCAMNRKSTYYKPRTMMLETLLSVYEIDLDYCYIIGDSWKDIVCGYTVGIKTIYIGDEYTCPKEYLSVKPDYIAKDILEACSIIEENEIND